MNITVVILSRLMGNLIPCLQAVRECEPDISILVIDDGLGGRPAACPGVSVIAGIKPFIFARNANLGMQVAAPRDGFILLNDDALLQTTGGLTRLAEDAAAHPEIGLMGVTTNVTGLYEQMPQGTHTFREVPRTFPFIGVYIPQTTIDKVGFLDERYCLDYGCEDNDYCMAVRQAGLKLAVHDGCYVDHGSLISTFRGLPETPKSFQQNYDLFLAKCEYCDRTGEPFIAGAGMVAA